MLFMTQSINTRMLLTNILLKSRNKTTLRTWRPVDLCHWLWTRWWTYQREKQRAIRTALLLWPLWRGRTLNQILILSRETALFSRDSSFLARSKGLARCRPCINMSLVFWGVFWGVFTSSLTFDQDDVANFFLSYDKLGKPVVVCKPHSDTRPR